MSSDAIIVHNKSVRYPADGLVCGALEGWQLPSDIKAAEVRYYSDSKDALMAVNRGEVDFVWLAAPIEQEIQQHYLYNAVLVTRFYSGVDISFALSWPAQAELLTLLNKSITRLSDEERSMIANQNMISVSKSRFALEDLVYSNPVMFVSVVALVLFLAVIVILMLARHPCARPSGRGFRSHHRHDGEFLPGGYRCGDAGRNEWLYRQAAGCPYPLYNHPRSAAEASGIEECFVRSPSSKPDAGDLLRATPFFQNLTQISQKWDFTPTFSSGIVVVPMEKEIIRRENP